ncbi:MAG TPA: histidinol dehydrogenase [Gemmatimonadaceae bacterium]|nr:histidinol dehydrogenase [Gemmatimonadaceae bacterium]
MTAKTQFDGTRHSEPNDDAPPAPVAGARGAFRFRGAIEDLTRDECDELFDRTTSSDDAVRARVAEIVARVRRDGDGALLEMARDYDGVIFPSAADLEVPRDRWREALAALDPALRAAMERAARNVAAAHRAFLPAPARVETEPGVVIERRAEPLAAVGVYAPGGRASYPSSVLMGVVPARVAGVGEVVVCSPPCGDTGLPSAVVLAAAELADADRVFAVGGAGAIAALAYGTPTIPRVDRVVGPGNAYVAEAKLQVAGAVAIDSPAGPSELLVLCDFTADPAAVAREVVAQAEHDPRAAVVVVAVGDEVGEQVATSVGDLLSDEAGDGVGRASIVREALASRGGVLVAQTYDEAAAFASRYAPEHLQLVVNEPAEGPLLERLRNAGTIFVGEASSVAFGDYMTGANHVLPTGGLARSYSGLSVLDFVRWTTYQRVSRRAASSLAADVGTFADSEGLPGHAAAARAWGRDRS